MILLVLVVVEDVLVPWATLLHQFQWLKPTASNDQINPIASFATPTCRKRQACRFPWSNAMIGFLTTCLKHLSFVQTASLVDGRVQ
jgi:hypothetical protein